MDDVCLNSEFDEMKDDDSWADRISWSRVCKEASAVPLELLGPSFVSLTAF